MKVKEFISQYRNHPTLFLGTGISLRYLEHSYTWDALLRKICTDVKGSAEHYLDIKSANQSDDGQYDFLKIATVIEEEFNSIAMNDRNGQFKEVNDVFYANMEKGINYSRFKIYIYIYIYCLETLH